VVSRRFAMNTVAVFVWTVFWTWMWGVLGGFVAVPILALLKLVSERVERMRPIAAFLEP
jgi:predicted PurR-regulated permease PerM